ncbi:hypothetical protein DENSPDRAFT_333066 [Dentipellis sp. KUC8613]|nr:hypothetical protein DENSPDRAFT_333066 [Dentipellis sp. KUC8613]
MKSCRLASYRCQTTVSPQRYSCPFPPLPMLLLEQGSSQAHAGTVAASPCHATLVSNAGAVPVLNRLPFRPGIPSKWRIVRFLMMACIDNHPCGPRPASCAGSHHIISPFSPSMKSNCRILACFLSQSPGHRSASVARATARCVCNLFQSPGLHARARISVSRPRIDCTVVELIIFRIC